MTSFGHVLAVMYKLREQLTPYPGGLRGYLVAPRSQLEYFVDLREDFTYWTEPEFCRKLAFEGKDFEEYMKVFLAKFSDCA
jgi:hypothetical protein